MLFKILSNQHIPILFVHNYHLCPLNSFFCVLPWSLTGLLSHYKVSLHMAIVNQMLWV